MIRICILLLIGGIGSLYANNSWEYGDKQSFTQGLLSTVQSILENAQLAGPAGQGNFTLNSPLRLISDPPQLVITGNYTTGFSTTSSMGTINAETTYQGTGPVAIVTPNSNGSFTINSLVTPATVIGSAVSNVPLQEGGGPSMPIGTITSATSQGHPTYIITTNTSEIQAISNLNVSNIIENANNAANSYGVTSDIKALPRNSPPSSPRFSSTTWSPS